jgi:hypothetical protein
MQHEGLVLMSAADLGSKSFKIPANLRGMKT